MRPVVQAQLLMATSGLLASFVSLDANFLTHAHDYYHWTQVLFVNGVVGWLGCTLWWAVSHACGCLDADEPLLGRRHFRGWLLVRGVFGAVENSSAWIALRYLDMADANVLMFTSPLFTGLLAWLLLGQKWRWYDNLLTLTSLVGVVLVCRPAFLFGHADTDEALPGGGSGSGSAAGDEAEDWQHWVGVAAGLVFAVTLARTLFLRPYLAHFCPVFSRFFRGFLRLDARIPESGTKRPGGGSVTVENGRGKSGRRRPILDG